MKRIFAVIMAAVLLIALCVPAMAADETGTITIANAVKGETYTIYKMADLESYDSAAKAYSYKPTTGWEAFFTAHSDVFTMDNGYIWLTGTSVDAAKLAKEALAYAAANRIAGTAKTADGDSVEFGNLPLGYYLIDSSLGALCGLTTTQPNATVNEKNGTPTVKKEVEEDSDGKWYDHNDADRYQPVHFRTTITAQAGAQNYVLHDKMTGLDLDASSIVVTYQDKTVDKNQYTVKTSELTDGCTFEIAFTQAFCDSLQPNDRIVVTYTAALNDDAVVGGNGNPNETWLNYGDQSEVNSTPKSTTVTYTYAFDLIKTDANNQLLDGAAFKLYDAETGGNEIKLVKLADGTYRLAKTGETPAESIVAVNGKVTISGLDGGTTYYLEETKAPEGYNKLATRQAVALKDANLSATFDPDGNYVPGTGVQIVNKTGAELPSTGGFGTTMFTLVGGALVIGCGILLFAKKRMDKIAG